MISRGRQQTYGWLIATDTFAAGVGGGTFLTSFILDLLGQYEPIARIGTILGPVLALIGTLFLLADVGSRTRVYRLLSNPSSWMSRGTLILAVFIIFGLSYSLPSLAVSEWKASGLGQGIGMVAAVFSVLAAVYPGFLFSIVKGVPFWNIPILPPLFFLSGLYTGIATHLLILPFFSTALGASGFHQLALAGVALIFMVMIILAAYFEVARHSGVTTLESIGLLKTPLFIGGAMILGLLVPAGLLSYSVVVSEMLTLSILAGVSSVFLLAGGLLLRYGIIRAGVYLPLRAM